jgi:MFS transporter, CP family, cyanate transporter
MAAFSHTPTVGVETKAYGSAVWVLLCGIAAALHVGKLPAMLALVAEEMQLSRVETGWLLAVFQIAGMLLGIVGGLLSDKIGRKRLMLGGVLLLGVASIAGGLVVQRGATNGLALLLALRTIESFAFMFAVLPGPGLLQSLVPAKKLRKTMGWWGAYMPIGMGLGLACSPLLSTFIGWRGVWVVLGLANCVLVLFAFRFVPSDKALKGKGENKTKFLALLSVTLKSRGPWLLAILFLCYAAQWTGLFGFLPTIYKEQGVAVLSIGWLTALAVFSNAVGNVLAGNSKLKLPAWQIIAIAACVMCFCSAIVLGAATRASGIDFPFSMRFAAVMVFSMVGGFIPGTIFGLVSTLAPPLSHSGVGNSERAIGTTAGMFQQGSALGQVITPPLVAWCVQRSGDWASAWWVLLGLAIGCLCVAVALRAEIKKLSQVDNVGLL